MPPTPMRPGPTWSSSPPAAKGGSNERGHAEEQPEILKELLALHEAWEKDMEAQ